VVLVNGKIEKYLNGLNYNMENTNSCCYVAKIDVIENIVGADNIEQARIGGWNCIIQKGQYNVGDLVVVATTDAIVPESLSDLMNVTNYLRKGQRVRTVKLRGVYSECLIIPFTYTPRPATYKEGDDMMKELNIFKYEPPVKQIQLASGKKIRYHENPNFLVYYKFPNLKNVVRMFTEVDTVQITRKVHGTNARYGIVKKTKLSLIDKIKLAIARKIKPEWKWSEYEYVYGSHNVEKGSDSQGFYDTDVWREIADKYDIKNKLWKFVKNHEPQEIGSGLVIYGEIYGKGIQKGYEYGLDEIKFEGFDVMFNGKYLSTNQTYFTITNKHRDFIGGVDLPHVDILYEGLWNQEIQDKFVFNNFINGTKVPHEGIVIKEVSGERSKVAKVINPDYLIYGEKHDIGDSH
jgi:RNA ligase (TIGR02306 family)